MRIHYLEIVTADVDAACKLYSQLHGVTFGDVDQRLGGARTATLANGGMIGNRTSHVEYGFDFAKAERCVWAS